MPDKDQIVFNADEVEGIELLTYELLGEFRSILASDGDCGRIHDLLETTTTRYVHGLVQQGYPGNVTISVVGSCMVSALQMIHRAGHMIDDLTDTDVAMPDIIKFIFGTAMTPQED